MSKNKSPLPAGIEPLNNEDWNDYWLGDQDERPERGLYKLAGVLRERVGELELVVEANGNSMQAMSDLYVDRGNQLLAAQNLLADVPKRITQLEHNHANKPHHVLDGSTCVIIDLKQWLKERGVE